MKLFNKIRTFLQFQKGILWDYGWLKSWWHNMPLDNNLKPLPWITYPAIDFISQFNFTNSIVFEWGSGNSTFWWSERCKEIYSLESNLFWYNKMKPRIGSNVRYLHCAIDKNEEVELFMKQEALFDIIIVDNHGLFRKACCEAAIHKLKNGGIIILDNSDQCLEATLALRTAGFYQIDFSGFAPSCSYAQTTSIFYKDHFNLNTIQNFQPTRSLAQPNLPWPDC